MSYTYNGVATNHANLPLLDNGDQVSKTSLMVGILQKIWDKILYVQGQVTGIGATLRTYNDTTLGDANVSFDPTLARCWRVASVLTGTRTYTFNIPASPLTWKGYTVKLFRTLPASLTSQINFVEQTSGRALGVWTAGKISWSEWTFDGAAWHMSAWDQGGTDDGTTSTSDA